MKHALSWQLPLTRPFSWNIFVLTDQEEEEEKVEPKEPKPKVKKESTKKGGEDYKNYSMDKLKDLLKDALDKEDYEKAAKIRDELGKRN